MVKLFEPEDHRKNY